jgi:hypothetical protein
MDIIQESINYYKANRLDFITQYNKQHLVIKGAEIIGIYKSNSEAIEETTKLHAIGTFIIEHPVAL